MVLAIGGGPTRFFAPFRRIHYIQTLEMPPRKKQVDSDPEEDFDDVDEEDEEDYRPAKVRIANGRALNRADASRMRACNVDEMPAHQSSGTS